MTRQHLARVVATLVLVVGLVVHIGFGYRFGLFVALAGLAVHVAVALAARRWGRQGS
ncbi:hypothetical protein [Actinokineospora enzanensis]|uniref:hypothetical protein n=1 Tax=Actinokineospora enzanensis TaxID=155975 RepID=UPI000360F752|nr:hypothetical protein [Actinokineospora enzanensis]